MIHEKSPYLLQHAHNPVDWHPWREETFALAHKEDKPIFLSIGYATCHWCHMMERESFEDAAVARLLNETFICIKVDREERPDIDVVYMAACHMMSGSGGWPLSVFMTPGKKPFITATYIPKENRFGRLGIIGLCRQIQHLWQNDRTKVLSAADSVTGGLAKAFTFEAETGRDESILKHALSEIEQSYDARLGGFLPAPKFPMPHRLLFLLRMYRRSGDASILEMIQKTLIRMRLGGIWDHVGYGFHRYSTDIEWLLPHFEKMLYDQALLATAYLEAYEITKDPFLAQTAEEIFTYVLRDMTDEKGGFYSAEDADSEGEEGKFYVWELEEFQNIVKDKNGIPWQDIFNLKAEGNFLEEASGRKTGANILHLKKPLGNWARDLELSPQKLLDDWHKSREALYRQREKRTRPLKDDKILTDWNGLMIGALALGGRILQKPEYTAQAEKGAHFILTHLINKAGRLLHRYREGEAAISATANDYAFFISGLLSLYQATLNADYLKHAATLQEEMQRRFWDAENGGFYLTDDEDTELPVRPKEIYDGAIPSANSVALQNLLMLSRLKDDKDWEEKADQAARAFYGTLKKQPAAFTCFLTGLEMRIKESY